MKRGGGLMTAVVSYTRNIDWERKRKSQFIRQVKKHRKFDVFDFFDP